MGKCHQFPGCGAAVALSCRGFLQLDEPLTVVRHLRQLATRRRQPGLELRNIHGATQVYSLHPDHPVHARSSVVGIIPDACQLPPSLQKTEQHVLRGAGGPGSMRRRHSNCSPASGRDQDVPLTRVGDPANGFSSCSRGAGESGGPGLGYPPGRAAPRPTRGWAGRGRRAAPAHRAGVPPSCGLRSGTWRNGSRVRGVAGPGTHASPIASSSIVKPRGECGPVVADGHHRGARVGPFSREQRPVDVLRTRIGEGGTGGREPSVWPVITPTGAKTPPVGTSPPGPQWLPRSCAAASLWS